MAYEPLLDARSPCNVYGEHIFEIRATFGSGSAVTYRSKDATIAKTTSTTYTVTLPKPYAEITKFNVGWYRPSGALLWLVATDMSALATAGTIVLTCAIADGTPTAPTSGDKAFITLGVSCDVQNDQFTG